MTKNLVLMVFSQGILAILSYCLNVTLTHFLPIESYGQLRYVISITSILIIFSNPGLSSAIFKCTIEGYHSFVSKAYGLTIKYSMWGVLILFILSFYYFFCKTDANMAWLMLIGAFVFPAMYLDRWNMVFMGLGEFGRARSYEVAGKLLSIILAGLAAWISKNPAVVLVCMFAVYLLYNPLLMRKSLTMVDPSNGKPEQDRKYRSYANRLTLYAILPNIAKHIDKILIATFLGFHSVSVYYIATVVPVYFQSSLKAAIVVPVQNWVSLGRSQALQKFTRYQWAVLGLSILTAGFLYLLMPFFIGLFGDEYLPSVKFAQVLCISIVVYPYTTLLLTMLKYLGEERITGRALNAYSVAKSLILLIIVPYFGIFGVVLCQVMLDVCWFCVAVFWITGSAVFKPVKGVLSDFDGYSAVNDTGLAKGLSVTDTGISSEDYTEV